MSKGESSQSKEKAQPQETDNTQDKPDNQAQNNDANNALEAAQAKAQENWEKLLRKEAELQNLRRRAEQDVEKAHKYAIDKMVQELMVVLDSFDQGLNISVPEDNQSAQSILEGMALTQKVFIDVLGKYGIEELNPVEKPFDPQFHEAISMQEAPDVPAGQVVAVVQKGYKLHDRVLRPARVVVSSAPATKNTENQVNESE